MNPRDLLARADRAQKSRAFKIVASVVIVALALASIGVWSALAAAPDTARAVQEAAAEAVERSEAAAEAVRSAGGVEGARAVRALLGASSPVLAVAFGVAALAAVGLLVTWMGLLLTYLGLAALAALVPGPMLLFPATRGLGEALLGVVAMAGAFAALLQGMRLALAGTGPVFAVARNVLAEAVRLKLSMVFIVMLVFLLAGLPFLLDPDQPLRYRVQVFLQWGTGGTFWLLAMLTVFFTVASVAFEQRDKIIWQTMTKPVRPWEYLLGKWVGVAALNAALLGVSAAGIFLFTERLRAMPAQGEISAYVSRQGPGDVTEDRRILESQVLAARAWVEPLPPEINAEAIDGALEAEIERRRASEPAFSPDSRERAAIRNEILREVILQYFTIEPGASQIYVFGGLSRAKALDRDLTLRYRFNSGTDNPSNLYKLLFVFSERDLYQRDAALGIAQTIPGLPPTLIDDEGRMGVQIWNGDPTINHANLRPMTFPPDGLRMLYVAGTYEGNYLRAVLVLWLKLCFIASVGIFAATFLSFPVACLVTFGVTLTAESVGYLREALEAYTTQTAQGIDYVAMVSRVVAVPIEWSLRWYGALSPTSDLTDGRLIPWGEVAGAGVRLVVVSAALLLAGWAIFRKRELAVYSGK